MRINRNVNLLVLVLSASLTAVVYGQQNQANSLAYAADEANVPDAIAKVKSGKFVHVELIAKAGAVEAVPVLKEQVVRTQDPIVKAKIANALVRLGTC